MSVTNSKFERVDNDWYVEPSWCVDLLIHAEPFAGGIWDPACGLGTIPKAFSGHGFPTSGSDIVARGYGEIIDFMGSPWLGGNTTNIVCNPPFSIATKFIDVALHCAVSKVAMLLPISFLASQARHPLFNETPVARVYILSRRPSMPPGEKLNDPAFRASGGSVDYCWIVWHHGHKGPPTMEWLK